MNARVISNVAQRKKNEHLATIYDATAPEVKGIYGEATGGIGGREVIFNSKYVPGIINGSDNNTVPHEFGHTLGLLHPDQLMSAFSIFRAGGQQYMNANERAQNPLNAMYSGSSGLLNNKNSTQVTREQVQSKISLY